MLTSVPLMKLKPTSVGESRLDPGLPNPDSEEATRQIHVPMSLASFVSALSVFWLILYCIHWISQHNNDSTATHETLLPTHRQHHGPTTTSSGHHHNLRITVRFLQARIETTSLNKLHDKLLNRLKKKNHLRMRTWLERFYTLGYVSGILGMVVALGLLVWTTWTLVKPISFHKLVGVGKLIKRDAATIYQDLTPESPITPILPGVTVPLNHIPFIIAALFSSQLVHELGHAVAGALYGIPILSSGASIIVCIPAAFVSYPTVALDALRRSARSRITSAGPFHSLLFWCFCFVGSYIGSGLFCTLLGYKDVSSVGRVVLRVEDDSPLVGHLAPGTIITKLNDHSMAFSPVEPDPWNTFLKYTKSGGDVSVGWCVDSSTLNALGKECCLPSGSNTSALACFAANTIPNQIGCLDPVPILTSTTRCGSETDCRNGDVCVRPAEKEELLRLTIKEDELGVDKVVLWSGPRREIWNEVTVGVWLPRLRFLPISLPLWGSVFWEYLLMVNLSLFLFNLIPLGNLDGKYFLHSILGQASTEETYNLDALERAETTNHDRYGALESVICRGTGVLVALDSVLIVFTLIRI